MKTPAAFSPAFVFSGDDSTNFTNLRQSKRGIIASNYVKILSSHNPQYCAAGPVKAYDIAPVLQYENPAVLFKRTRCFTL